jgi:malate dehydrogenase (quinone)
MMQTKKVDVLLVGSGVMSTTLASLFAELSPNKSILMVERLDSVAAESTDAWNNAGTGHAGYCELNYTPLNSQGHVEINRALSINASFEVSLQFWAYLVENNILPNPSSFINPTPHLSFVWGKDDVEFLRQRYSLLKQHPLFADMQFSDDPEVLKTWMPLIMQTRDEAQEVAATRVDYGTDIDFGALTRQLVTHLQSTPHFELALHTEVKGLKRQKNGRWKVRLVNRQDRQTRNIEAQFVFLGAGGGALKLLQQSKIAECKGYGGFPVSGQWLVCNNPEVVRQHSSKVYGKAALGAPPMSVPHLDTRIINGKPALLFGPYAGFTTKFLKQGSYWDLFKSLKLNNLKSMLSVALHHFDLTKYLISEALQTHQSRMQTLRQFYPKAQNADWHLESAGKRVQVIKHCDDNGGKLEFGTEIVAAQDGSITALLGASPGASVSVQAMINVLERCFADDSKTEAWQQKIRSIVPSYGESLIENEALLKTVRARTLKILKLKR